MAVGTLGPWQLEGRPCVTSLARSRRATTFDDGGDEAAVAPKRLLLQMKVDHEVKGKAQPLGSTVGGLWILEA